mgnify:CR=1 FL=1
MREQWGSRYGFILATIGASVGLGNIWRFSYVAGENGGAAFLIVYLVFVILIGLPLVIAELSLGRRAQGDAIAAFGNHIQAGRWRMVGFLGIVAAILVLSYYAVIAGWALKYFTGAATGSLWRIAGGGYGEFFRMFISDWGQPAAWQAAMLALSMFVVAGGVRRGIEAVNRLLMPVLAVILVALAAYSLFLPDSGRGVSFLFAPDWSVLATPGLYVAALGQAFFSLGIGMAVFVTYGSYMPRTFSLPGAAAAVVLGDALFAIVAGVAIFPAVFSFGVSPAAGPELAFITLPQLFLGMPFGRAIGTIFFFLLVAAAFTSMVSLLEVPVSMAVQRLRMDRWRATALIGIGIFALGLPSALSYGVLQDVRVGERQILDMIDAGVSNFVLPATGILVAVFLGWRLERSVSLGDADMTDGFIGRAWLWLLKFVVPLTIVAILLESASAL